MNIPNLITQNKKLDKRYKFNKLLKEWFNIYTRSSFLWGIIIGTVLGLYIADNPNKKELSVKPKIVKIEAKEEVKTPCEYDPITYIRCSGEKLGKSNKDIMTMIRIAKAESGFNKYAINKNKDGTFDIGILQINDVHNKRINRQERMDFIKNIDFGWKLHTEQRGFGAWVTYKNGLVN